MSLQGEGSINDKQRFYYLLSSIDMSADELKRNIDKNGDGYIVKSEFSYFAQNSEKIDWSEFGINKNDKNKVKQIINAFWDSLDINNSVTHIGNSKMYNQNCLSKDEEKTFSNNIAKYQIIDTILSNIQVPNFISDYSAFRKSVKESLIYNMEKNIPNASPEEAEEYLKSIVQTSVNKTAANEYAKAYIKNSFKGDNAVDGYDYNKDEILTKRLVDNLVFKVASMEDITFDEIKAMVNNMVNAYKATAELTNVEGLDYNAVLAELGYKPDENSEFNKLQKQVLYNKFNNCVKDDIETLPYYAYLKEHYNVYKDNSINNIINSTQYSKFSEAKENGISFSKDILTQTEFYNFLTKVNQISQLVDEHYIGLLADNASNDNLYKSLADNGFPNEFIQYLYNNRNTNVNEAWNEVKQLTIAQFIKKAIDENISVEDLFNVNKNLATDNTSEETEISQKDILIDSTVFNIFNSLDEFFPDNYPEDIKYKMSLKELEFMYTKSEKAAINKGELENIKLAAINYCRDIAGVRGQAINNAICSIFGTSDYKTAINNLAPGEIPAKMKSLIQMVNSLGDIRYIKINCSPNLQDEKTYNMNSGYNGAEVISLSNVSFKDDENGNNIDLNSGRISFEVYCPNGSIAWARIENNNLVIGTGYWGTANITLNIKVDGVTKYTKTIAVNSRYGADRMYSERNVNYDGKSIAEMLQTDTNGVINSIKPVCLTGFAEWNSFRNNAKGMIDSILTNLKNQLINAGYNENNVNYAITSTYNYYCAAIDSLKDICHGDKDEASSNYNFTYNDANGNSIFHENIYYQYTRTHTKDEHGINYLQNTKVGINAAIETFITNSKLKAVTNIDATGLYMNEAYAYTNNRYNLYLSLNCLINKLYSFMSGSVPSACFNNITLKDAVNSLN